MINSTFFRKDFFLFGILFVLCFYKTQNLVSMIFLFISILVLFFLKKNVVKNIFLIISMFQIKEFIEPFLIKDFDKLYKGNSHIIEIIIFNMIIAMIYIHLLKNKYIVSKSKFTKRNLLILFGYTCILLIFIYFRDYFFNYRTVTYYFSENNYLNTVKFIILAFFSLFSSALIEEQIFRGILPTEIKIDKNSHKYKPYIITSIIFVGIHFNIYNELFIYNALNLIVLCVVISFVHLKTKNIIMCAIIHTIYNFFI